MIISKTPYRISLCGGLSDIPAYYNKDYGTVVSTSIDKYIYISVAKRFDKKYRLSYSRVEEVEDIDDIKHPIIRATLKHLDITDPLEISSFSTIPGRSGLGSSSAFTVGLLDALYSYIGKPASKQQLAEEACKIEIDILKEPIGKQDQYATAIGGLNKYTFYPNHTEINRISMDWRVEEELENNILLFYTDITRYASSVLNDQKRNIEQIRGKIDCIRELAFMLYEKLESNDLSNLGNIFSDAWALKKETGSVSSRKIDMWYDAAIKAGATGGKISGAGGGGFLMLYCEPKYQDRVREALGYYLKELPFKFEDKGSRIIYEDTLD